MLEFYFNNKYKYTNRSLVNLNEDLDSIKIDYLNIDSPDTIHGGLIYEVEEDKDDRMPTYIVQDYKEGKRRWFVSGITQLSSHKFRISLVRDVASEYIDTWKFEEAFIKAGTASDYNKYKSWGLPFTNTKINETKLPIGPSGSKSSFFVYYVNKQNYDEGTKILTEDDFEVKYTKPNTYIFAEKTITNTSEIPNYDIFVDQGSMRKWTKHESEMIFSCYNYLAGGATIQKYKAIYDNNELTLSNAHGYAGQGLRWNAPTFSQITESTSFQNGIKSDLKTFTENYASTFVPTVAYTEAQWNSIKEWTNKVIFDSSTNKYFKLNVKTDYEGPFNLTIHKAHTTSLKDAIGLTLNPNMYSVDGNYYIFKSKLKTVKLEREELGFADTFEFNFNADISKLPKSAVRCVNIASNSLVNDFAIREALMTAYSNQLADIEDGRILDIQYLPFSLTGTETSDDIVFKSGGSTKKPYAKFINIDEFFYTNSLTDFTNLNEVDKETKTCKIVSPSRASQFLFKPYNNDGVMEFQVKINLQPFNSRIYIRPSTKGLLMHDWDDKDCFIMEEDCSLTTVDSAWRDYVYQNRNYNAQFNRQIQGREFERGWERDLEKAQMRADEWNARNLSAQKARAYTGNLPIIGSISGAIGTAFKDNTYMEMAALDREYNEALYQESVSLAEDMFSYQIDNIKNQAPVPTKITTLDNKLLDGIYIEEWDTNETERAAIERYYAYNGHRIDTFGVFNDYMGDFVKGKIIKSDKFNQPEFNELNRRLELGIYIYKGD